MLAALPVDRKGATEKLREFQAQLLMKGKSLGNNTVAFCLFASNEVFAYAVSKGESTPPYGNVGVDDDDASSTDDDRDAHVVAPAYDADISKGPMTSSELHTHHPFHTSVEQPLLSVPTMSSHTHGESRRGHSSSRVSINDLHVADDGTLSTDDLIACLNDIKLGQDTRHEVKQSALSSALMSSTPLRSHLSTQLADSLQASQRVVNDSLRSRQQQVDDILHPTGAFTRESVDAMTRKERLALKAGDKILGFIMKTTISTSLFAGLEQYFPPLHDNITSRHILHALAIMTLGRNDDMAFIEAENEVFNLPRMGQEEKVQTFFGRAEQTLSIFADLGGEISRPRLHVLLMSLIQDRSEMSEGMDRYIRYAPPGSPTFPSLADVRKLMQSVEDKAATLLLANGGRGVQVPAYYSSTTPTHQRKGSSHSHAGEKSGAPTARQDHNHKMWCSHHKKFGAHSDKECYLAHPELKRPNAAKAKVAQVKKPPAPAGEGKSTGARRIRNLQSKSAARMASLTKENGEKDATIRALHAQVSYAQRAANSSVQNVSHAQRADNLSVHNVSHAQRASNASVPAHDPRVAPVTPRTRWSDIPFGPATPQARYVQVISVVNVDEGVQSDGSLPGLVEQGSSTDGSMPPLQHDGSSDGSDLEDGPARFEFRDAVSPPPLVPFHHVRYPWSMGSTHHAHDEGDDGDDETDLDIPSSDVVLTGGTDVVRVDLEVDRVARSSLMLPLSSSKGQQTPYPLVTLGDETSPPGVSHVLRAGDVGLGQVDTGVACTAVSGSHRVVADIAALSAAPPAMRPTEAFTVAVTDTGAHPVYLNDIKYFIESQPTNDYVEDAKGRMDPIVAKGKARLPFITADGDILVIYVEGAYYVPTWPVPLIAPDILNHRKPNCGYYLGTDEHCEEVVLHQVDGAFLSIHKEGNNFMYALGPPLDRPQGCAAQRSDGPVPSDSEERGIATASEENSDDDAVLKVRQKWEEMVSASTTASSQDAPFLDLHRAMGHLNVRTMRQIVTHDLIANMPDVTKILRKSCSCGACLISKYCNKHPRPFPATHSKEATPPNHTWYADFFGPISPASIHGDRVVLVLVDRRTGYVVAVPLRSKDACVAAIVAHLAWSRQFEHVQGNSLPRLVRSDGEPVLCSEELQRAVGNNVTMQQSPPYTPELNGPAEAGVRSVKMFTTTYLLSGRLSPTYWNYSSIKAASTLNLQPCQAMNPKISRYEALCGKPPQFHELCAFGALVIVGNPHHTFLKPRALLAVYLAPNPVQPRSHFLLLLNNLKPISSFQFKVVPGGLWFDQSMVVEFYSQRLQQLQYLPESMQPLHPDVLPLRFGDTSSTRQMRGVDQITSPVVSAETQSSSRAELDEEIVGSRRSRVLAPAQQVVEAAVLQGQHDAFLDQGRRLRSRNDSTALISMKTHMQNMLERDRPLFDIGMSAYLETTYFVFGDSELTDGLQALSVNEAAQPEPLTADAPSVFNPKEFHDTLNREPRWADACTKELVSLFAANSIKLVPLSDADGHKALPMFWVLKVKRDNKGAIEKFKARVVPNGALQIPGVDYFNSSYTTVDDTSVMLTCVYALDNNFDLHTADTVQAFPNAPLDETTFCRKPLGFEKLVPEIVNEFRRQHGNVPYVILIQMSLYGLCQSGYNYVTMDDGHKKEHGLIPTAIDKKLYIAVDQRKLALNQGECDHPQQCSTHDVNTHVVVACTAVFVDDELIAAADGFREEYVEHMQSTQQFKDEGRVSLFLGMSIRQVWTGQQSRIFLSLEPYINQVKLSFPMEVSTEYYAAVPQVVPISKSLLQCKPASSPDDVDPKLLAQYQKLLGVLVYISCKLRDDIALAVAYGSSYASVPTPELLGHMMRAFRYVCDTSSLTRSMGVGPGPVTLEAYVDTSFASTHDRRSISSWYIRVRQGSFRNILQSKTRVMPGVASSSTEAEYKPFQLVVQAVLGIRQSLADIGYPQREPTPIYVDNKASIDWAVAGSDHRRRRHVDIQFHSFQQHVVDGAVVFVWVAGKDQLADFQTKVHCVSEFLRLRRIVFDS